MGQFNATYSIDPTALNIDGVKAGDAAEMESKLQALIASAAAPALIVDLVLAGVEEGPAWEATLALANAVFSGTSTPRASAVVYAAVAGNKTELYEKLKARLAAANAVTPILTVQKTEVAGGGDGSNFMALALVNQPPV